MSIRLLGPVLVALLLPALISRATVLFLAIWFLIGLSAITRLWTWRMVRQVRICRRCDDRAIAGQDLTVTLQVRNAGRLPVPYVEVRDDLPVRLTTHHAPQYVLSLGGREERRLRYTITCRNRGHYTLGPTVGQTSDPFSLHRRALPRMAEQRLIVYPRIVPLRRLGLPTHSTLMVTPASASLLKDPSRIVGIREYQPSDPLRSLHWGASARMRRLMVKQHQPAISRATLLCLDLDRDAYPNHLRRDMEQAIVVAASMSYHIITHERSPVGLAVPPSGRMESQGDRGTLAPREGRAHLMAILEVLAGVEPCGEAAFVSFLRTTSPRWGWGTTVVAITGRLDPELTDTLALLLQRGHAVAVILVGPQVPCVDEPLMVARIPVYRIWDSGEMAA